MAAKEPAMSPSEMSVAEVLDRVSGPRRGEADQLVALCAELTGEAPVVWANRIIGFGVHEYLYESGHGGRVPELGFATGSARHTIYLTPGFSERWQDLLTQLGPHKASKACLYVTRLAKIDTGVLTQILRRALDETREGVQTHS